MYLDTCIIYRPEKKLKEKLVVAIEVSVTVKTKNTFKYQISTNSKSFGQIRCFLFCLIVWIGVSSQKHHPLFFGQAPLKSADCPSPPF